MGRHCRVCRSPRRPEIDAALAAGMSYRNISEQFRVPVGCLFRHACSHVPGSIAAAKAVAEAAHGVRALEALRSREDRFSDWIRRADLAGDLRSMLAVMRSARREILRSATLRGELRRR